MTPSLDQMTPEPLPRRPAWMKTVERRSFSAISPKLAMGILLGSVVVLAHRDGCLFQRAATHESQRDALADRCSLQLRVNIFQARDAVPRQRNDDVADDQARRVRGTIGFDFQHDRGCFFLEMQ